MDAARQSYIGLGFAMAKVAELKIETTTAEGFDNKLVDKVLELKAKGLKSVCLLYVGFGDKERDWLSTMKKIRNPMDVYTIRM